MLLLFLGLHLLGYGHSATLSGIIWLYKVTLCHLVKVKQPNSNDTVSRKCNLWWSIKPTPGSFQGSTCPSLQLSMEGTQTLPHSGGVTVTENVKDVHGRARGRVEGQRWWTCGAKQNKGESRNCGRTTEQWASPPPTQDESAISAISRENGKLWSSSQAQGSEMQAKSSLFKQNMNFF